MVEVGAHITRPSGTTASRALETRRREFNNQRAP